MITYCSPTLASIKTANLFTCAFDNINDAQYHIDLWNGRIKHKGVELILFRMGESGRALIYVCRKSKLNRDLSKNGTASFLRKYGYESTDADYAIERLKTRIEQCEGFPHEIGVFLGYPLGDVIGFIENGGANCKCNGCWKVYCDECEAMRIFERFNKCTSMYTKLWGSGKKTICQLTVAC